MWDWTEFKALLEVLKLDFNIVTQISVIAVVILFQLTSGTPIKQVSYFFGSAGFSYSGNWALTWRDLTSKYSLSHNNFEYRTWAFVPFSCVASGARSTFVSQNISRWRQISALYTRETRIHTTSIKVALAESSIVAISAAAGQNLESFSGVVQKVSVFHARTIVVTCANTNHRS